MAKQFKHTMMKQKHFISIPTVWCSIVVLLAGVGCNHTTPTHTSTHSEPLFQMEDPVTNLTGYQNSRQEIVIPAGKYTHCMTDTFRTHAIVLTKGDQKWVVIDRAEKVLYEIFPFDNGPDYPSEGLFRMIKDGKIGYADANTYAIVIPPQFDCAFPFENGKAKVSTRCTTSTDGEHKVWTSDTWQYVDKKGKF